MHQNVGTDDGVVVDDDFTGQFGTVADDTIVSNKSIMGYMYAFHQQITTAYAGFAFAAVPRLIVTFSRILLLSPTSAVVSSPWNFKS